MFTVRQALIGTFLVAAVGAGLQSDRPAVGIHKLIAAQENYNCRCRYDHVFNGEDNHNDNQ